MSHTYDAEAKDVGTSLAVGQWQCWGWGRQMFSAGTVGWTSMVSVPN